MSLLCAECDHDLGPSESLPGREGSLVHPSLISLVYVPGTDAFKLRYTQSTQDQSLCFQCVEEKVPTNRLDILKSIYRCYELERKNKSFEGKWLSGAEMTESHDILDQYIQALETLEANCLFCGNDVERGLPYFTAKTIDRLASSRGLSTFGSYSFSNVTNGTTSFKLCFNDFRLAFPNSFRKLGFDLLGERDESTKTVSSFEIGAGFEDLLKKEGVSLDEIIDSLADKGVDINIIRQIRKE